MKYFKRQCDDLSESEKEQMMYFNPNDRYIYLNGDVSEKSVGFLIDLINKFNEYDLDEYKKKHSMLNSLMSDFNVKDMEKLESEYNPKPITLVINSYGGSIYDGLSLINVIKASYTPIVAQIHKAMSMALIIASVCQYRIGYEYSNYMFHGGSAWTGGRFEDIKDDMKENDKLEKLIIKITKEHTKMNEGKMKQIIRDKKDFYFESELALKMGMIDEIFGRDCEEKIEEELEKSQ